MSPMPTIIQVGLVIAALLLCGAILWIVLEAIPRRRKVRRFAGRSELSPKEINEQFFRESGVPSETVAELWNEVAQTLDLPSGKLRPEDRFDAELGPVHGWEWGDDLAILNRIAAKRLKKLRNPDFRLEDIKTIRDYVLFFGRSTEK